MAAVLAITPGSYAAGAFAAGDWTTFGWYLAAIAGAVAVAFSLRASSVLATLRSAALHRRSRVTPCLASWWLYCCALGLVVWWRRRNTLRAD